MAATLGGTTTATASGGEVIFSNLTLNKAAAGYALELATAAGVTPALTPAITIPFTVMPQQATQLAVTTVPLGNVMAGNTFTVVISAEDSNGNVDTGFSNTVTLSLLPGGTPLGTPVQAINGVATFTGLTLNRVGSGFSVQATGPSSINGNPPLSVTSSTPFNVVAAAASQLLVTTQPTPNPVVAGSPFTMVVTAEDRFGNVAAAFSGPVTLSSSSTLGGTTTATIANGLLVNGVATFTNLTLGNAAVVSTVQATGPGVVGAISNSITVTPAKAVQLVVTTEPPASVTADVPFGLVVAAEDGSGNLDPTYGTHGETVTISLANNTGATLSGTLTVPVFDGVATFSNLILTSAANGYLFSLLSSTNLTGPTAGPLNVVAAPATQLKLVVTNPPVTNPPPPLTSITPGQGLGITVTAEDPFFNTDTSYNGPVTLSLGTNPSNSNLGGTTTVQAVRGVATFTGVTLNQPFIAATATATLTGGVVSAINVTSGGVGYLATNPPPVTISAPPSGGVQATATAIVNSSGVVTGISLTGVASIAVTSGGSGFTSAPLVTLSAPTGANPVQATAIAVVSPFVITGLMGGSGYVTPPMVTFTGGGGTSAAATAVLGTGSTAGQVVSVNITSFGSGYTSAPTVSFSAAPAGGTTATASTTFGVVTGLTISNPGNGYTTPPTVTFGGPGSGAMATVTLDTGGSGYTSAPTVSLPTFPYTITAASGSLSGATSGTFLVANTLATQLKVTAPPASLVVNTGFSLTVTAVDASGHVVPSFTGIVTLTLLNPGTATLLGTVTAQAVGGVATFSSLSLNSPGTGFQIQASGGGLAVSTATVLPAGITVTPVPATQVIILAQPPSTIAAGSGFSVAAAIEDSNGNLVPSSTATVSLAIAKNPGGSDVHHGLLGVAVGGLVLFTGLTLTTRPPAATRSRLPAPA